MGLIYLGILSSYIAIEMIVKFIPEPQVLSNPNCLSYFCLMLFFFDINYSFLGYRYRKTAILFTGLLSLISLFLILRKYYEPKLEIAKHTDFYFIFGLIMGYYFVLSPSEDMPIVLNEENLQEEQDNASVEFNKSEIPKAMLSCIRNILFCNLIVKFFIKYKTMNAYTFTLSQFNYKKLLSDSFNEYSLFFSGYVISQILQAYMKKKKGNGNDEESSISMRQRIFSIIKQYIVFVIIKLGFALIINTEVNEVLNTALSKYIPQKHYLVLYNMFNISIEKKSRLLSTILFSFI